MSILIPNFLVLRCYSWTASRYVNGVNYSINSSRELDALESLVEVGTLPDRDSATVKPQPWITVHVEHTRENAAEFYGKHTVTHGTVEAFQFFKNEKLLVWFKRAQDAETVARILATGQISALPAVLASVSS